MTKKDIIKIIEKDTWMMNILKVVRTLNLPDWWIGAGFVRSKVWDYLHGYKKRTPLPDIDVIYFDKNDFTKNEIKKASTKTELRFQNKLKKINSKINWSVTNQARMHALHNNLPYKTSEDGLSQWVETATCVGVRLLDNNKLILSAPRGIEDLVNLILRPTPAFKKDLRTFNERVRKKEWLEKWPKLKIVI